ETNRAFLKDN
ncbi:unnamed protein product, partial [Oikopleura dioica]